MTMGNGKSRIKIITLEEALLSPDEIQKIKAEVEKNAASNTTLNKTKDIPADMIKDKKEKKTMLTVFNVGQGDAFLLQPECGCDYDEPNPLLLIDTGSPSARIKRKLPAKNIIALLTHSHEDHIGGVPELITSNKLVGLFLPYYLPEITSIFRYIRDYVSTRFIQPDWSQVTPLVRRLLKEGDCLCGHIKILNPPMSPSIYFNSYRMPAESRSIERALAALTEMGMDLPIQEIVKYETPLHGENIDGFDAEYVANARNFVHQFFITLSDRVRHDGSEGLSYHVDTHLQLTANQASVVFMYSHPENDKWLFTGDADETVFERLIGSGTDISAKYLKVPHHGSRENLSRLTLRAIAPKVAVVSHKNRRFGRSLDSHPHHEVIDMLDRQGIRTYYTNPVVKDGMTIKKMATGIKEKGLIRFV